MNIQELIVWLAPYVVTAITFIGVIIKVVSSFRALKKDVVDLKEMHEIKTQMTALLKENIELKKTLNETMTKIDHIERK